MPLPVMSAMPSPSDKATAMVGTVNDLPKEQVDAIIRTKRKAREPKACYPCHTRKVKCDRRLPCDGCVKRDHADLCTYERPAKKRQNIMSANVNGKPSATDGETITVRPKIEDGQASNGNGVDDVLVPKIEWEQACSRLKEMEKTISVLRTHMEHLAPRPSAPPALSTSSTEGNQPEPPYTSSSLSKGEGIHAANEYGNSTVHLGSRSVLAYILGHPGVSQDTASALLDGGLLPKLGLDNESATYPFLDLWSSTDPAVVDTEAVCAVLPDDASCRRYITLYRDITSALYPVLPEMDKFLSNVELLLQNRAAWNGTSPAPGTYTEKPYGLSMDFVGLVFAVLAAGCLASDLPEKGLTSQVYICCSYQFLRAKNYMSQPTLESVETLLIIGSVLSYNMNPGVSYVLLGMTIRLTLVLGLHVNSHRFPAHERLIRQRVWWSMAWQDSNFSLSYDRPSSMAFSQPDIPYAPDSSPGNRTYFETLCRLISLTLGIVRSRMLSPNSQMSFGVIMQYQEEMQRILEDASPKLRERELCDTPQEHLERLALKLHASYICSELCRPSLRPYPQFSDRDSGYLRRDCIVALTRTVEAYVELHNISPSAAISWIALQRAISCAFLLLVLGETKNDARTRDLLRQLEVVLGERASQEAGLVGGTGDSSPSVPNVDEPRNMPSAFAGGNMSTGWDPYSVLATGTVPPVATVNAAQWTTPLTKSYRTLQKLNAALSGHTDSLLANGPAPRGQRTMPPSSASTYPPLRMNNPPMNATAAATPGADGVGSQQRSSIPPLTPDSSASHDGNLTSLLDRASEYIYPPLWS